MTSLGVATTLKILIFDNGWGCISFFIWWIYRRWRLQKISTIGRVDEISTIGRLMDAVLVWGWFPHHHPQGQETTCTDTHKHLFASSLLQTAILSALACEQSHYSSLSLCPHPRHHHSRQPILSNIYYFSDRLRYMLNTILCAPRFLAITT